MMKKKKRQKKRKKGRKKNRNVVPVSGYLTLSLIIPMIKRYSERYAPPRSSMSRS